MTKRILLTMLLGAAGIGLGQTVPTAILPSHTPPQLPAILNSNFTGLYNTLVGRSTVGFGYSFPSPGSTSITRYLTIPFACAISSWSMVIDGGANTTANLTSASKLLDLASGTGISAGQSVTGAGIAVGTTVANQPGPAWFALSQAATATGFTTFSRSLCCRW
ncbi:MAG TPA: hypothetical protein VNH18_21240 [Bryobacteraceae bacterium]|nr:hypothetical protein [Bryobacteraceae bacterium]